MVIGLSESVLAHTGLEGLVENVMILSVRTLLMTPVLVISVVLKLEFVVPLWTAIGFRLVERPRRT